MRHGQPDTAIQAKHATLNTRLQTALLLLIALTCTGCLGLTEDALEETADCRMEMRFASIQKAGLDDRGDLVIQGRQVGHSRSTVIRIPKETIDKQSMPVGKVTYHFEYVSRECLDVKMPRMETADPIEVSVKSRGPDQVNNQPSIQDKHLTVFKARKRDDCTVFHYDHRDVDGACLRFSFAILYKEFTYRSGLWKCIYTIPIDIAYTAGCGVVAVVSTPVVVPYAIYVIWELNRDGGGLLSGWNGSIL